MPLTLRAFVLPLMAAAMLVLSGCQTAPNSTTGSAEGPAGGQGAPASASTPQASRVAMYVARDQPGVGLTEVKGAGKPVYVPSQPSLTRADIVEALALADNQGQHFVGLRFTPEGARKLNDLSSQNVGSMLALFIDDDLVASPRIGAPLNRGVLAFGVPTAEIAISIAGRIRGDVPNR